MYEARMAAFDFVKFQRSKFPNLMKFILCTKLFFTNVTSLFRTIM